MIQSPAGAPPGTALRLGEQLLTHGAVNADQLREGLDLHHRTGVRLGEALISLGHVTERQVAAALGVQARLPVFDLDDREPDPATARLLPKELARGLGVLPLYEYDGTVVLACTELPDNGRMAEVERRMGRPLKPVLVTESALQHTLNDLYRDEYREQCASELLSRLPDDSACQVLSRRQKHLLLGALVLGVLGTAIAPLAAATAFAMVTTLAYFAFSVYKLYLLHRGLVHQQEMEITPDEIAALDDRDLPIYTILVPVYKEAEVFPVLVRAIDRINYPSVKLDVKILLEEDDEETIRVAQATRLPKHFQLVIVPRGKPKGKPRACNYGLIQAKGEYVVIYDAEDIPDPDQLKKAIIAFRKGGDRLCCVQAKLNYFNGMQNLLTRWFTVEYSMWFDLLLPSLASTDAPIPLGGTSNHFRVAQLRDLGAWDPYNVTEDADLGVRLYKVGGYTAVIESTTYEEANSRWYNWVRQRSRWIKGYVQTYLVHMRHPLSLWRATSTPAFISLQFILGGTFFVLLMNPFLWALMVLWFVTKWKVIETMFPSAIYFLGGAALYIGNFTFAYLNVFGCLRRRKYGLIKYSILSPIYWAVMSLAAWKGFLQLFYAPSYWEKTQHGLVTAAADGVQGSLAEGHTTTGGSPG